MAGRPTIADLAEKAGVSVSTVDRVLNRRDPVRRGTAEKVLAAAEAIGFYATPLLRERMGIGQAKVRLGFLLQQSNRTFYRLLADALRKAAQAAGPGIEAVVDHMNDLAPDAVAARMQALGETVDALAVVSAEHPRVTQAIEALAGRGVPTYALISGLTAACGVGYIGLDNWKVGRTSGWAIANICKAPGKVGILVGNHRYRCQEMNESGFRSYFREHAPEFQLLEPLSTFEDRAIARDVTETLLQREPDLAGLFISGGGITGAMEALAASGQAGRIVTVGYELMELTRSGLLDGALTMVIAHPLTRLAAEAVEIMAASVCIATAVPTQRQISFEIYTAENL